ncbi:MAG: hypothetical protein J6D52_07795, partial [Clostridia bacterium]|nr:hypothetical protein [Clostridia bacterium]
PSEEFSDDEVAGLRDESDDVSEILLLGSEELDDTSFSVLQPVNSSVNNKTKTVSTDKILTSFIMYTSKLSGTA